MEETIGIEDKRYPVLLKKIADPPDVLYVRGTMPPADAFLFAVVGSRKATMYGKEAVHRIVPPLAKAGMVIVSGLAYGIDARAHEETLEAGGVTVAVLGSSVDKKEVFPVGQRPLAERIVSSDGALISEFPPGTRVQPFHFPLRNRIIAGMAKGTLVVEAAKESGSLITSRAAGDDNRDVFAVPGSIFWEMCEGTNNLIKMGARPVTDAEDIFAAFGQTSITSATVHTAGSAEEAALLALLAGEPRHIDDLTRASGLDAAKTSSTLTLMEMKGSARHMGGLYYVRG